jgi:hypothetical protein
MPRPVCPKCAEKHCSRRKREGFVQIFIWPRLGWYPWQCSACRHVFTVKFRGKSKRKRSINGEASAEIVSTLPPNRRLNDRFEDESHDES